MKKFMVISLLLISAPAALMVFRAMASGAPINAQAAQMQATQYASPTLIPTATVIPTATIGYEATLAVAQSTADEARRVNAEVTAVHEANLLSLMQLTADTEYRAHEVFQWTAQAAPTAIPLTATQQAIINAQIAQDQSLQFGAMTATAHAPTQISAMAQAQAAVQFAGAARASQVFGNIAVSIFLLALIAFLVRMPMAPSTSSAPDAPVPQVETVVHMRRETGAGTYQQTRAVIPCAPGQLTELATHITEGTRTLAINQWEGANTSFTRPIFHQMRAWLQENKFAVATGDGQLVATDEGLDFLCGWLDMQRLPDEYAFVEENSLQPENQVVNMDLEPL